MAKNRRAGARVQPEGVTIQEGYTELTKPAFAVWIRLMIEPERILEGGVERLGRALGYRRRGFFQVMQELRNKGYVRVIAGPCPRIPSMVKIQRRAMLVGRDHFIKLS